MFNSPRLTPFWYYRPRIWTDFVAYKRPISSYKRHWSTLGNEIESLMVTIHFKVRGGSDHGFLTRTSKRARGFGIDGFLPLQSTRWKRRGFLTKSLRLQVHRCVSIDVYIEYFDRRPMAYHHRYLPEQVWKYTILEDANCYMMPSPEVLWMWKGKIMISVKFQSPRR